MKWFLGLRLLFRLLIPFFRAVWRGDPYAISALAGMIGLATLVGFIWFAKRPLGGDPEKTPIDEALFRDDANPYRQ
jgi:hypothetical protein